MAGYTKLFNSILASTIWREDDKTRIVWITLLAMSDKDGICEGSVPGLADFARVTVSECEKALEILSSPDKYSRTSEHEGRRIEAIDGVGWRLLNHAKYRLKMSEDERREYNRKKQAEHRAKIKGAAVNDSQTLSDVVNDGQSQSAVSAHTDTDTHTDTHTEAAFAAVRETDEEIIFTASILSDIKAELGLKKFSLSDSRKWENEIHLAYENGFKAEDFVSCFRLLRRQEWRTSAVRPNHVTENLSDLAKLKREIAQQKGSSERLPTLEEKLADRGTVRFLPPTAKADKCMT